MTTEAKSSAAALALVAALGLGASGAAQAGHDDVDVFWSIAMSQPGIHVGVSNMPAAPVVVYERPHVHARPVYVPPPRVVYLPPHPVHRVHPGYYGHGYGHWKDRDERWEGRRGGREHFARNERYEGRGHEQGRGYGGGNGPRPGTEGHMGNRR
jgi:hypothetical protein